MDTQIRLASDDGSIDAVEFFCFYYQ
jgi:hypothetical protein